MPEFLGNKFCGVAILSFTCTSTFSNTQTHAGPSSTSLMFWSHTWLRMVDLWRWSMWNTWRIGEIWLLNIHQRGLKVRGKVRVKPREVACCVATIILKIRPLVMKLSVSSKRVGLFLRVVIFFRKLIHTQLVYSHIYMACRGSAINASFVKSLFIQ